VKYIGDDMMLGVFDEDVTDSDKVGETQIKLSALCLNGGVDEWFEIQHKGKSAGKVHLRSKYGEPKQQYNLKVIKAKLETAPKQ
jgi:hypothetical protein